MAGESRLQTKIKRWLRDHGWLVVKISLCSKPGWPDLEAIKKGRTIRLEIKNKRKIDELQEFRHQEIQAHGGEVFTAATWQEFMNLKL